MGKNGIIMEKEAKKQAKTQVRFSKEWEQRTNNQKSRKGSTSGDRHMKKPEGQKKNSILKDYARGGGGDRGGSEIKGEELRRTVDQRGQIRAEKKTGSQGVTEN